MCGDRAALAMTMLTMLDLLPQLLGSSGAQPRPPPCPSSRMTRRWSLARRAGRGAAACRWAKVLGTATPTARSHLKKRWGPRMYAVYEQGTMKHVHLPFPPGLCF